MARNKKKAAPSSHGAKNGSSSPTAISENDLAPPASHLRNGNAAVSQDAQDSVTAKNASHKAELGGSKPDTSQGGKPKNGKNGAKVPPLPAGFLESELTMHKRKLKTTEHFLQACRQEIASLKGQITTILQENRELLEGKQALEQWKAAQEEIVGAQNSSAQAAQWTALWVSVVAVGTAAAVVWFKPTIAQ